MDLKNLGALVYENKLDAVVSTFGDRGDLRGYPGLVFVFEPDPCALAVDILRHAGVVWGGRNPSKCRMVVGRGC